jgi:hypothetical protein
VHPGQVPLRSRYRVGAMRCDAICDTTSHPLRCYAPSFRPGESAGPLFSLGTYVARAARWVHWALRGEQVCVCGEAKVEGNHSIFVLFSYCDDVREGRQGGPGGIREKADAHNTYSCMCTHWRCPSTYVHDVRTYMFTAAGKTGRIMAPAVSRA